MSYNLLTTPEFEKEAKRISKKYPSLKNDLKILFSSLIENPIQGFSLGNHFYKLRLAISGKKSGKSGGARIITFIRVLDEEIILVSIYDKSVKENITKEEIKGRLSKYFKK